MSGGSVFSTLFQFGNLDSFDTETSTSEHVLAGLTSPLAELQLHQWHLHRHYHHHVCTPAERRQHERHRHLPRSLTDVLAPWPSKYERTYISAEHYAGKSNSLLPFPRILKFASKKS